MEKREKLFERLTKIEKANMREAKTHFAKRISLYQNGCNLLEEVLDNVCRKKEADMQDIAIVSLCSRTLGTSKVIYELSIRGYQYDTAILVRSLFENSIALWYVSKNEDNAEKWLSGKKQFSDIKKELGISSNNSLKNFYDSHSEFVHSNFAAILSLIDDSGGENVLNCTLGPERGLSEKGNFLANFWVFPLNLLIHHYESYFALEIKDKIKKIIEKARVSTS